MQATNPQKTTSKRLTVNSGGVQIKIELSPVLRGTVWPVDVKEVSEKVENLFGHAEMKMVPPYDLYAGKICAALDRQHPRDLFDIKLLFENEGVGRDLFKTFLVYLISHGRPMAELLSPSLKDISRVFDTEFRGMTEDAVTLDQLLETRIRLIKQIQCSMTDQDRRFLLSVKKKEPDWSLMDFNHIKDLPAVKWKLINLRKMDAKSHAQAVKRLEKTLDDGA